MMCADAQLPPRGRLRGIPDPRDGLGDMGPAAAGDQGVARAVGRGAGHRAGRSRHRPCGRDAIGRRTGGPFRKPTRDAGRLSASCGDAAPAGAGGQPRRAVPVPVRPGAGERRAGRGDERTGDRGRAPPRPADPVGAARPLERGPRDRRGRGRSRGGDRRRSARAVRGRGGRAGRGFARVPARPAAGARPGPRGVGRRRAVPTCAGRRRSSCWA